MTSAARPLVSVYKNGEPSGAQIRLPSVFLSPIRTDIVHFVHTNMAKNRRQPYAVNEKAGHQHSAESWGTGRAVSRIPRVSGSGTMRSGQAAFGNMCRKGRMFAPTKIWRKWHRKINTNQRRFAVASALAASAVTPLVMARGHKIDKVPELPLVVNSSVEKTKKTKKALEILASLDADADVEKVKESKKLRAGKGKYRNRRFTQRRGPLVVYGSHDEAENLKRSFRNIAGVDLCCVDSLNLLQLAPGGHLGRFIIWTKPAFKKLDALFGTTKTAARLKKDYKLPQPTMANADLARIINSDEVQSRLRPVAVNRKRRSFTQKKNPLKNVSAMLELNPYAKRVSKSRAVSQNKSRGISGDKRRAVSKARFQDMTK